MATSGRVQLVVGKGGSPLLRDCLDVYVGGRLGKQ